MKVLLFCAGALVIGQGLSTDYQKAGRLRIETTSSFSMETTAFSMERDGQPVDNPRGGGGMSSREKRHVVQLDEYADAKGGQPTRVRRTFERIEGKGAMQFGERSQEIEREAPLEDVTLEITVGSGDKPRVKAVEGSVSDDALLEGHLPALGLDAFLPEDEVEVGAAWELGSDAILRGLGFDVEPALFPPQEPAREEGGEGRRGGGGGRGGFGRGGGGSTPALFRMGTWEGKATLASLTEEHEGEKCAAIVLELSSEGELPQPSFGGGRGRGRGFAAVLEASPAASNEFEIKAKGRLLYSLEGRRPVHLEVEGKVRTERHMEGSSERGSFSSSTTQEGEFNIEVRVTQVEGE